jgi:hypothetical protein
MSGRPAASAATVADRFAAVGIILASPWLREGSGCGQPEQEAS